MSQIKIVIFGDRPTCSFCQALYGLDSKAAKLAVDVSGTAVITGLRAAFPDAEIVDADRTFNLSLFNSLRPSGAFNFPSVRVFVNGKAKAFFEARRATAATLIAKINAACPECCAGCAQSEPATAPTKPGICPTCSGTKRAKCPTCGTTKTCYTCKGKGKV